MSCGTWTLIRPHFNTDSKACRYMEVTFCKSFVLLSENEKAATHLFAQFTREIYHFLRINFFYFVYVRKYSFKFFKDLFCQKLFVICRNVVGKKCKSNFN